MKLALIIMLVILAKGLHAQISIQPYHKNYSWNQEWSEAIKDELSKESYKNTDSALFNIMIDREDLNELQCPGYNNASAEEKTDFWIAFFSGLTRAESGFNPKAVSGKSRGHRSYGLLQLAKQTAKKECDLDPKSKDVLNPEENLRCGIKLIQWQLQGAPTASGKKLRSDLEGQLFGKHIFQWGPLRQNDRRGRKLLVSWFKNHLDQMSFCGKE